MILTADEVSRSFRGTMALLNRRIEGLDAFDMSEAGFWRSFRAIWLTLPAFVVTLALERQRLGLATDGGGLFDVSRLTLAVAAGHVGSFLALPLAMIPVARRLGLEGGYAPFVIVTNWIAAAGSILLSLPSILLLVGWATPGLFGLFTAAFAAIVLRAHWFAAKATLRVSGSRAAVIVAFGLALDLAIGRLVEVVAA